MPTVPRYACPELVEGAAETRPTRDERRKALKIAHRVPFTPSSRHFFRASRVAALCWPRIEGLAAYRGASRHWFLDARNL
jgi:hypothetical protein